METLLKFDRVVLTKELNEKFKKVGDVFEIANILDDSFVLREAKTRVAVGVVDFKDFERCFVKKEDFKSWTPWVQFIGFDGQNDAYYRTNRRKVQVKFIADKVRAEACCCKDDDFNLFFGIQLAYLRCLNKALAKQKNEYSQKLKAISCAISDNKNLMREMINSLEVKDEVV